jgi:hypothetical protein
MDACDADDLVEFRRVRIVRSTAPALLCRIGGREVWLPRHHISGRLWCSGDCGTLFIRRWLALDRHLLADPGATTLRLECTRAPSPVPAALYAVATRKRDAH